MAGKKKDIAESPRLEDIPEIPKEEQPYPLPDGWKWVRLGNITKIIGGGTPPSKKQEYYQNGDIPWITPADLSGYKDIYISRGSRMITKAGLMNSSARMLPTDTVCLSSRASIGYVAIAENPISTNQGFKNFLPSPLYYPRFLYWYLKDNKSFLESYASGTTFLEISGERASQIIFPLPPLETQHRIVNRIESLFSKLDEAAEKVQAVIDSHEARKQAILHKAFSGELTKKWREEKGISLDSWENRALQDLCHCLKYGTSKKSEKTGKMIVIRMGNLQDGEIVWEKLAYTNDEDDISMYRLTSGDILFNRTNSPELVGKTSIYRGEVPAIYAGYLIKLDYNRNIINGEYLNFVMNSNIAKGYCNMIKSDGINQSNINAKKIGLLIIPVPSISEQDRIVEKLTNIFSYEKHFKQNIDEILDNIGSIKKSILNGAFCGGIF